MNSGMNTDQPSTDQPLLDFTQYGARKDDSITDSTESAAVTQHSVILGGKSISYTARVGHLVTTDQYSARPVAKIFYVSFTANGIEVADRTITYYIFFIMAALDHRRFFYCWAHLDRGA